jgi:DNA-binding PadR family transcriptional regulator
MPVTPANTATGREMTSPVNWALLGLLIERPSYGRELYSRFQRVYADVLAINSESHIYSALDALEKRGLIAVIPIRPSAVVRQPKPQYQATQSGLDRYVEWLVKQVDVERRRQELWVRQLAIFAENPRAALHVLGRFRSQYLRGAGEVGRQPDVAAMGARDELIDGLVAEHRRIAAGGMIRWLRHAHDVFQTRAAGASRDDPPRT